MFTNLAPNVEPPDTYHWSYRGLRREMLSDSALLAIERTGLIEKVEPLVAAKHFRSAMQEFLDFLDGFPSNPYALTLILTSFFSERALQFGSPEPLTRAQLANRHLDPIFSTCTRCERTFIQQEEMAIHMMGSDPYVAVSSFTSDRTMPDGVQCTVCGATYCKICMPLTIFGPDSARVARDCPNCGRAGLNSLVFPTGRLPQSMKKTASTIGTVFLVREGPLPPDREYVERVLEVAAPQALGQGALLIGVAVRPERLSNPLYGQRILQALIKDRLSENGLEAVEFQSLVLQGPSQVRCIPVQVEISRNEDVARLRKISAELFTPTDQIGGYGSATELGQPVSELYSAILNNLNTFNLYELHDVRATFDALNREAFTQPALSVNPGVEQEMRAVLDKLAANLDGAIKALELGVDMRGTPISRKDLYRSLRRMCRVYGNLKILNPIQAMYGLDARQRLEEILDRLWLLALSESYPGKRQ